MLQQTGGGAQNHLGAHNLRLKPDTHWQPKAKMATVLPRSRASIHFSCVPETRIVDQGGKAKEDSGQNHIDPQDPTTPPQALTQKDTATP